MFTNRNATVNDYPALDLPPRWPSLNVSSTFLPVIERMRALRETRPEPVTLAFASIDHRGGTSYVTSRLSNDLRLYTGQRVAICSALELRDNLIAPPLLRLTGDVRPSEALTRPISGDKIHLLQQQFDYVLLDCPPLRQASDAMLLARRTDGLCLIVESGKTTRSELQSHIAAATRSNIRIFGLILNKRKYPVPDFIYRML